jgi:hypothetical protein
VIEDSCDLPRRPPARHADRHALAISVTSFALSHILTAAGTGGMVLLDDTDLVDRCLTLRRWGRRSEPQFFGSRRGERHFFSDLDGIEYDNLFIFDEIGWNFEPSEISAAFGRVQLRKLPGFLERRKRNFARLYAHLAKYPERFVLPRTTAELDTAWHLFPFQIRRESGVRRGELQQWMESQGVDTRMVWSGNICASRVPEDRAPRARRRPAERRPRDGDRPDPALQPRHERRDVDYICATLDAFLERSPDARRELHVQQADRPRPREDGAFYRDVYGLHAVNRVRGESIGGEEIDEIMVAKDPNAPFGSLVLLKYLGRAPSPSGELILGFTTDDLAGCSSACGRRRRCARADQGDSRDEAARRVRDRSRRPSRRARADAALTGDRSRGSNCERSPPCRENVKARSRS